MRGDARDRALWRGFAGDPRLRLGVLAGLAVLAVALWLVVEGIVGRFAHPAQVEMQAAARQMQIASQILRSEKAARGLLPGPEIDPNQTGLVGPEFTEITTSLGYLAAKRTATNPDLAAALARRIHALNLGPDAVVVALFSGSIPGGNLAVLSATGALDLETITIASIGASMYGANDPEFTWADMEGTLAAAGVIDHPANLAMIGGGGGVGSQLTPEGVEMIRSSIRRNNLPLIVADEAGTANLLAEVEARILTLTGGRYPDLFINVGGSVAAFGDCAAADVFPPGLSHTAPPCLGEVPGLLYRMSGADVPVIHILNMRALALDWGLPYDPIPFAMPGNNRQIYGSPPNPPS